MGYGIVLTLDLAALDAADDAEVGAALVAALGDDDYPVGGVAPRREGPWHVAGAYHSSADVALHLEGTALVAGPAPDGAAGPVSATWTAAEAAAAARELWRRPERLAAGTAEDAALGPDPLGGGGDVALWWAYADALGQFRDADPAVLGAQVRAAARARTEGTVAVGAASNALSCAGRALSGLAAARWSGNRLTVGDGAGPGTE